MTRVPVPAERLAVRAWCNGCGAEVLAPSPLACTVCGSAMFAHVNPLAAERCSARRCRQGHVSGHQTV